MKKIIGYILMFVAGVTLGIGGLGCNTWEFWVIILCFGLSGVLLNND